MIIGVLSDTHEDATAVPHIIAKFKELGVEYVLHCGDIYPEHLDAELFGGFPVACALIDEQVGTKEFENPPPNWIFTFPGERIIVINGQLFYLGHKRPFEYLMGSERDMNKTLSEIGMKYGRLPVFGAHIHVQIYKQDHLNSLINPGAVTGSYDGHEYAVLDTATNEISFRRIPKTKPVKPPFSVGVISDTLKISETDPTFWGKLRAELEKRGVNHVIHCGNIAMEDIGRPELAGFKVHYNLRGDQSNPPSFENWELISDKDPVVTIEGYRFYVQLDLGADLMEQSLAKMDMLCLGLRRKHPEISYVLCGFTSDAILVELPQVRIINPGDANYDRSFAVIGLPTAAITFGHVPVDPLPAM